jgi:hypothetical protein
MSGRLERNLRNDAEYYPDEAEYYPSALLIEAADTLKRYREFITTLAERDDSIGDDARQALSES